MVKKFTSLNNSLSRRIVGYACREEAVKCYTLLFNSRTLIKESLFKCLFKLVMEICPPTYNQFKELHPQIQSYMNVYYTRLFISQIYDI